PQAFGLAWGVSQIRAVLAGYLGGRGIQLSRRLRRVRRGAANDMHCPPAVNISVVASPAVRLNPDSEPMTYRGATDVRVRAAPLVALYHFDHPVKSRVGAGPCLATRDDRATRFVFDFKSKNNLPRRLRRGPGVDVNGSECRIVFGC